MSIDKAYNEGRIKSNLQIVNLLIKKYTIEEIIEITKLTREQIESLK